VLSSSVRMLVVLNGNGFTRSPDFLIIAKARRFAASLPSRTSSVLNSRCAIENEAEKRMMRQNKWSFSWET